MFRTIRRARSMAAAVALGAVVLSACGQAPAGAAAVVNGYVILDASIGELLAAQQFALEAQGLERQEELTQLRDLQRQVLGQAIRDRIIAEKAVERGITIDEAELDDIWEEQIIIFGDEAALLARLDELGLTQEVARARIRDQRLLEELQVAFRDEIVVTDADVQALYDSQSGTWLTRSASHIMLETQAQADDVVSILAADPEQFYDLALERSVDTQSGAIGGTLGEQPRGVGYPENFESAIWDNPVGSIVGPIQTDFGFHVIQVDAETFRSFDDVREQLAEQIRAQLFTEQFGNFENALWAGADIQLDSRYGTWDPLVGEVVQQDPLAS